MRAPTPIWFVFVWGCGFSPVTSSDARPEDAPPQPDSAPIPQRVQKDLIGLWTFNDPDGSAIAADTAGVANPVPLDVEANPSAGIAAPTFASGSLIVTTPGRLLSAPDTHLNADCITSGAVTLEVWAKPALVDPDPGAPLFVAGLAANINERNIALLQRGNRWVGRVRTTSAADGTPDLESTSPASTIALMHIVIVADLTQRVMYVNDSSQATSPPGTLTGWNSSYRMALVDEVQHARLWTGTLALVALYKRALTRQEVHQNFLAGPAH